MLPFDAVFTQCQSVLILGFGREGRSTLAFLKRNYPFLKIGIADRNREIAGEDLEATFHLGENYLDAIPKYDLVLKSPGVKIRKWPDKAVDKITSQTGLFLRAFGAQTVGVTGTKGKSTTVSLLFHLLQKLGKKALLMGNIGLPAFDFLDKIDKDTVIVYELSAHQLENVRNSPHWAVLVNLFPEHLDYFGSFETYRKAKMNIFKYQHPHDLAFCGIQTEVPVPCQLPEDEHSDDNELLLRAGLHGRHNLTNILLVFRVLQSMGYPFEGLKEALRGFSPLPHRLEHVGKFSGIDFYNDSISTVPQSTVEAVKSIPKTDVLILGGFDRGLDYTGLVDFLQSSRVKYLFFMGKAGDRMFSLFQSARNNKQLFRVENLTEVFEKLKSLPDVSSCLLSPAAASYDRYHNFEHRGDRFKAMARKFVR